MSARELLRPCSRRTRRSRRSTSDVRSSVLGGWGGGGDVARSHGRRLRAGARCRVSSRLQLGGARAASGPLGGCVAPPCRRDACRVGWVLCTPQGIASASMARELWRPHSRRTGHSRRSASEVRGSVLAVAGEGGGGACGAVSRPAAARGRTMQSELALAVGRRACGVGSPCRARGSSSCRRDACHVGWVLCTPQTIRSATTVRELWRPRSRRTGRSQRSASNVRSSVLVMAGEGGRVARSHGRRLRAGARCRASSRLQLGGARVRRRVPLAGAWLLLLSA
jgi:hypothetical protein